MSALKKLEERKVRIVCDCGFIHDLTSNEKGELSLESTKAKETTPPAPKKKVKGFFEPIIDDEEEGNE